jgi:ADP-ribose pyrophosphatase YjhB (NUDIX family)
MTKPITPLVGCDVFILDTQMQVLLIRRSDNGLWALPGGCQELHETPVECAQREAFEETGLEVKVIGLLGVFSSLRYDYVHYPWKENVFTHILYRGEVVGGAVQTESDETSDVAWFSREDIPEMSDGHHLRVSFSFSCVPLPCVPYFE